MSASSDQDEDRARGVGAALKRIVLGALTTLVTVNLLTGGPLLALWVGSRIQTAEGHLSMGAVSATLGILIVETFLLYKALTYLNAAYNEAIGRTLPRRQVPWHKPMSGERRSVAVKRPLSATERIVVATVVLALLAFEGWFFVLAHARLPA
jgi:hypothetical protein